MGGPVADVVGSLEREMLTSAFLSSYGGSSAVSAVSQPKRQGAQGRKAQESLAAAGRVAQAGNTIEQASKKQGGNKIEEAGQGGNKMEEAGPPPRAAATRPRRRWARSVHLPLEGQGLSLSNLVCHQ